MVAANVSKPPNSPDSCNLSGLFLILGARMPKDSMRIEWWDIDKVIPYENNPRHNDDAVEKVANSLRAFGWKQPCVVDADGVLIVGHTQLKAAKHGSDEFYELDHEFERVLRRWSNLLHVSSARMEYDIEAAYKAA